ISIIDLSSTRQMSSSLDNSSCPMPHSGAFGRRPDPSGPALVPDSLLQLANEHASKCLRKADWPQSSSVSPKMKNLYQATLAIINNGDEEIALKVVEYYHRQCTRKWTVPIIELLFNLYQAAWFTLHCLYVASETTEKVTAVFSQLLESEDSLYLENNNKNGIALCLGQCLKAITQSGDEPDIVSLMIKRIEERRSSEEWEEVINYGVGALGCALEESYKKSAKSIINAGLEVSAEIVKSFREDPPDLLCYERLKQLSQDR
ncbi:uncharacterized protein BDW70DRAFT_141915, partial [Aspergillus foveolatus]|uniref:uncharacterized protein n=1 Tax=Aspergillus foveolatus TaxID=210207 RepID=UPI003CCD7228